MKKESLTTKLCRYLCRHGHISNTEFRTVFRAERLAPRIQELRNQGIRIRTSTVLDDEGQKYTRYEAPFFSDFPRGLRDQVFPAEGR